MRPPPPPPLQLLLQIFIDQVQVLASLVNLILQIEVMYNCPHKLYTFRGVPYFYAGFLKGSVK